MSLWTKMRNSLNSKKGHMMLGHNKTHRDDDDEAMDIINQATIDEIRQRVSDTAHPDMVAILVNAAAGYLERQKAISSMLPLKGPDPNAELGLSYQASTSDHQDSQNARWEMKLPAKKLSSIDEALQELLGSTSLPDTLHPGPLNGDALLRLNGALNVSQVIWALGGFAVLKINHKVAVKIGSDIDVEHTRILDLIEAHTRNVPIPKVLGIIRAGNLTYLFQSYLDGTPLDTIWPDLSVTHKVDLKMQLNDIFQQIRSVPMPMDESGIATLGSGEPRRCKDARRYVRQAQKPITNENDFNAFLLSNDAENKSECNETRHMIRAFIRNDHDVVLTHADLHPRNIMVRKVWRDSSVATHQSNDEERDALLQEHFRIIGIIDWELCGWYPSYWEYVKALHTINSADGTKDWWRYLPEAIGTWGSEYAIDLMISRWIR